MWGSGTRPRYVGVVEGEVEDVEDGREQWRWKLGYIEGIHRAVEVKVRDSVRRRGQWWWKLGVMEVRGGRGDKRRS